MGWMFESCYFDALAILISFVVGVITYFKWNFAYWKKRNVPYLEPSFPFGNIENPITSTLSFGFRLKNKYDELKALGHKHAGLYNFSSPVYFVIDPEYVKNVMQKDFHHFVNRGIYYNEKDDPLSAHLFALGGEKWRNLRVKLTPTFTSGKMKMMFETLVACSDSLTEAVDQHAINDEPVDIKELSGCFTTDIIGSVAFGLECNSFKNPNADFRKYGKKIFKLSAFNSFKAIFLFSQHKLGRKLGLMLNSKDVSDFFLNVVKDTVNYRESNNIVRNDMLQLLIELKNNKSPEDIEKHDGKALSIEEVAAQAFAFFLAGFETSSTTMEFCLFELATNPDIQEKVRNEINTVLARHNGEITYEAMVEMKYMGQVIDETLRKYPPVTQVTRQCVEDYKVPNTDVIIEKGTNVFIPILALQRDPEYFPDPEKFNPDRFSEENKKQIRPFTYLPFGEGPRFCMGFRFGIMQAKVGLTMLLKNYRFTLNRRTEVPLKIDPKAFFLGTKNVILLTAEKLN